MSIAIMENVLHFINCLMDTDTQPNLVARSFFPAQWMEEVSNEHSFDLCLAMNDPILTLGQTELFLRLGDLCVKTIFFVVESLSVNNYMGTDLMD